MAVECRWWLSGIQGEDSGELLFDEDRVSVLQKMREVLEVDGDDGGTIMPLNCTLKNR